jgi:hypothetical protein
VRSTYCRAPGGSVGRDKGLLAQYPGMRPGDLNQHGRGPKRTADEERTVRSVFDQITHV